MLPARYDFSVWESSTFRRTITVLQADVGSPAMNLTGYTAVMNIRTDPDTTPVFVLSTSNGRISLGGTAGTVSLFISAADTLTFDTWEPTGLYDLAITNTGGNGDVIALLWGQVKVKGLA